MKTSYYLAWLVLGLTFTANAAASAVKTIEYGVNHSQPVEEMRLQQREQLAQSVAASLPSVTRQEMQQQISAKPASKTKVGVPLKISSVTSHSYYHEFRFYDVQTYLLDDFNYDGFYHSFSLNIDADVYGATAGEQIPVYAVIYTSRNGGDWRHLHTTNVFYLQGESAYDSYEVVTSLDTGFPTDYYDVLIDLYEYGYDDVVATISSDNTNSLYALPLQSYDRDNDNYGEDVVVSGGSLAWTPLLSLGLLGWCRRKAN
ncbi:choice-of-anchor H family protein [Shewanella sp.]|uniref:choice-of-anchor H family protein n=1 Tax=Shewanella sp. TaxID=50422 RepID=UPI003A969312